MTRAQAVAGAACYVYYRVNIAQLEQARNTLATLLAEVCALTGIEGTLSRRIDPKAVVSAGAEVTLMEIYAGIADPAAFEAQLQDATRRCELQRFLAAGATRSIEWFAPLTEAQALARHERG